MLQLRWKMDRASGVLVPDKSKGERERESDRVGEDQRERADGIDERCWMGKPFTSCAEGVREGGEGCGERTRERE